MAKAICSGGASAIKSFSSFTPFSSPIPIPMVPGLVEHAAVNPELQIGILNLVDATGSATLGDVIEHLAQPHSATAALALVAAGALDIETVAVIDANTRITRPAKGGEGGVEAGPPEANDPLPDTVTAVRGATFEPEVFLIEATSLSHIRRVTQLMRPGVYVAWSEGEGAYVGTGGDVAKRIAMGNHLGAPTQIAAIVDRNGNLTPEDAQIAERILHQYLEHAKVFSGLNGLPIGTNVEVERYDEIRVFVANALMLLRRDGILKSNLNARQLLAGPRSMSDSKVVPIPGDGVLHELDGLGVIARAIHTGKDWILLRGSTVRRDVVPSANSSASLRRAEWLHGGILRDRGDAYEVVSNIRFDSPSAAAQFVSGSKGRSWVPIGPATSRDLLALY